MRLFFLNQEKSKYYFFFRVDKPDFDSWTTRIRSIASASLPLLTDTNTGNSATFGDLTTATRYAVGTSSPTRGIVAGGAAPAAVNTIEYVTIATTGDATNFGDMSYTGTHPFSVSNKTRGIITDSSGVIIVIKGAK